MEAMTTIGQRLKQIRLERGLSQAALAKQANVSQGTIGNIESGQRGYGESIVDIAAALRVTPAFLRLEEGIQDAQFSSWPPLEGPHASGAITLPASLDTITAAITALSPPDREQLAKALAILAVAPDSAEAKARVLVLLQPAHSVPGTESKAFQPPVPQSSTVNPTTA